MTRRHKHTIVLSVKFNKLQKWEYRIKDTLIPNTEQAIKREVLDNDAHKYARDMVLHRFNRLQRRIEP